MSHSTSQSFHTAECEATITASESSLAGVTHLCPSSCCSPGIPDPFPLQQPQKKPFCYIGKTGICGLGGFCVDFCCCSVTWDRERFLSRTGGAMRPALFFPIQSNLIQDSKNSLGSPTDVDVRNVGSAGCRRPCLALPQSKNAGLE